MALPNLNGAMEQQQQQRVEEPWANDPNLYSDVRELGKGAYGTVWVAKHRVTGEEAAKKRVRVALSDEGVPQSVLREISALRHLEKYRHPNVVRLLGLHHGLAKNDTELYMDLIFEKCDWDLHTYLSTIPCDLEEQHVRLLARQLFGGLAFLHEHCIVHRDVKPQNILINKDGSLKVADFGLARLYSLYAQFTTVAVTLWYRSPEVLLQTSYGPSCDVWSAACVLAELYSRRPLFPAQSELEQICMIFAQIGLPPRDHWPEAAVLPWENFAAKNFQPQQLSRTVPRASTDALNLLAACLRFLPNSRISAREAISQAPFLAGCQNQGPCYVVDASNGSFIG